MTTNELILGYLLLVTNVAFPLVTYWLAKKKVTDSWGFHTTSPAELHNNRIKSVVDEIYSTFYFEHKHLEGVVTKEHFFTYWNKSCEHWKTQCSDTNVWHGVCVAIQHSHVGEE